MKRKTVVALLATMTLAVGGTCTVFAMNSSQFSDVKANTSYFNYVESVVDKEIMEAESDTEFGVAEKETRGGFISALYALAKNPLTLDDSSFEDVKGTDNELAVRWAEGKKLFEGLKPDFFTDGKFDSDKELTREEMAVILYNYGKYVDGLDMSRGVGSYDSFADHEDNKVSDTYAEQVKWAVGNKLLAGDDRLTDEVENNLRPTMSVNRVEVAEALYQYSALRDTLNAEKNVTTKENEQANTQEEASVKSETPEGVAPESKPDVNPEEPETKPEVQPETKPEVKPEVKPEEPNVKPEEPEVKPEPENPDVVEPEVPHEHTWVDNMVEVKHPEVGHWEQVEVKPAWVENIQHEAEYEDKWVVDKEAEYDTVHHPAEYEQVWVVDKEAEYNTIHHDAVYEDVWVVDKEAWTEYKEHAEEGYWGTVTISEAWDEDIYEDQIRLICSGCGEDITDNEYAHSKAHALAGEVNGYYDKVIPVKVDTIHHPAVTQPKYYVTQEAYTEEIPHAEEGHYEPQLKSEAYDEKVLISEEQGHYEDGTTVIKPAWDEDILISEEQGHYEKELVKEAWTETKEHPAEYEDKWVVDQEEYTETVNKGEICSECGETR